MTDTDPTDPIQRPEQPPDAAASSWAPPSAAAGSGADGQARVSRVFLLVLWVGAVIGAAFVAVLASRRDDSTPGSPDWWAYVAGGFMGPFLVALLARAAYVLVSRGRGFRDRPLLRSQWIPLGALLLTGVNLVGNAGALAPPPAVAPADAIRISGPFTLRAASADTQQIAAAGFKNDKTIRAYEVREIVGDDGSLSLLVVVDGPLREGAGAIEQVGRGIESASGLTATYETIRDRRVAIAVGDTLSIGAWIEQPLGVYVYAVTPTRLHQIIEGILDAPRPRS